MKKKFIMMALALALTVGMLAGCGSEIVESAVTETQVIYVNEPSAVEQAMESADYEFIDETQPLLDFEKEYENMTAAEEIRNAGRRPLQVHQGQRAGAHARPGRARGAVCRGSSGRHRRRWR